MRSKTIGRGIFQGISIRKFESPCAILLVDFSLADFDAVQINVNGCAFGSHTMKGRRRIVCRLAFLQVNGFAIRIVIIINNIDDGWGAWSMSGKIEVPFSIDTIIKRCAVTCRINSNQMETVLAGGNGFAWNNRERAIRLDDTLADFGVSIIKFYNAALSPRNSSGACLNFRIVVISVVTRMYLSRDRVLVIPEYDILCISPNWRCRIDSKIEIVTLFSFISGSILDNCNILVIAFGKFGKLVLPAITAITVLCEVNIVGNTMKIAFAITIIKVNNIALLCTSHRAFKKWHLVIGRRS